MGHNRKQLPLPGMDSGYAKDLGHGRVSLRDLTVRELDQQLAIASRTKSKGLKTKVLAEYKRRGVKPPTKE